jgi:hypothetical protein
MLIQSRYSILYIDADTYNSRRSELGFKDQQTLLVVNLDSREPSLEAKACSVTLDRALGFLSSTQSEAL